MMWYDFQDTIVWEQDIPCKALTIATCKMLAYVLWVHCSHVCNKENNKHTLHSLWKKIGGEKTQTKVNTCL